ncbi:MAG: hypothetical protein ACYCQI_15180 [Gammaproteobacteria bacterium]
MLRTDAATFNYTIEQQTAHITRAVLNDDLESYELWRKRKSKEVWRLEILETYCDIDSIEPTGKLDLIRLNRVEMFKKLYRDDFFHSYITEVLNLRVQAARFNPEILRWLYETEDSFSQSNKLYYINEYYRRLCQYDDIPKASVEYLLKKFKEETNSLEEPLKFAANSGDGGYHPLLFKWALEDAEAEALKGNTFLTKEGLVDILCRIASAAETPKPRHLVSSKLELMRILLEYHRINANTHGDWLSCELFELPKMSAVNIVTIFDLVEGLGILVAHGADINHLSMKWLQRKPIQKILKMLKEEYLPKNNQICIALDAFRALNTKDLSPKDPRSILVVLMQKVMSWGKGKFTADDYAFLNTLPDLASFKNELEKLDSRLPILIDICKESIRKANTYCELFNLKWGANCLPTPLVSLIAEYHEEIPLPAPIANKAWHPKKEKEDDALARQPKELSSEELEVKAFTSESKQAISKENADRFIKILRLLLATALKPECTAMPTDFHGLFSTAKKCAAKNKDNLQDFLKQNLTTLADEDVCLATYLLLSKAKFNVVGARLLQKCPPEMYQFLLDPVVQEKESKEELNDLFVYPDDVEYKLCLFKFAIKKVMILLGLSVEEMNVTENSFIRKFQTDALNSSKLLSP